VSALPQAVFQAGRRQCACETSYEKSLAGTAKRLNVEPEESNDEPE